MSEAHQNGALDSLAACVAVQREISFTDPSTADPEDALGILIAKHLQWDGHAILRVAFWALEDANFHSEAETIVRLLKELGEPAPWERPR